MRIVSENMTHKRVVSELYHVPTPYLTRGIAYQTKAHQLGKMTVILRIPSIRDLVNMLEGQNSKISVILGVRHYYKKTNPFIQVRDEGTKQASCEDLRTVSRPRVDFHL